MERFDWGGALPPLRQAVSVKGWSTATQVGAMATVLVGEIIELVKYEKIYGDLNREYDVKSIKEKGNV